MNGQLTGLAQFPNKKQAHEYALVLQSAGIPHHVQRTAEGGYWLLAPEEFAVAAAGELKNYQRENVDWPPKTDPPPRLSNGRWAAAVYVLWIAALFPIGRYGFLDQNFWEAGKLVAYKVTGGEWWRAFTALNLHADLPHLVGNSISGAAFGVLTAHVLGSGLTWLSAVLAGGIGNVFASILHRPEHSAIGASTAVFGIIGILAAYEWMRRHSLNYPAMRRWGPIAGAALLFGYLGTSGERTDVIAHMTGFLSGMGLGAAIAWKRLPERIGPGGQAIAGGLAMAILVLAWMVAL
ncbi:MAG: rhomboid protease GluP [Planctomycetota bacterium]|jgi:rhomboid protease GluP